MSRIIQFESLLSTDCHPPIVFHHAVDEWPARSWTEEYLAEQLQARQFQCKVSPVDFEDVLMETDCLHLQCSMQQYYSWLARQQEADNPLSLVDPVKYSCYIDYKYMKDMFVDSPEMLKEVSWEKFGFPGRDGAESTIWIGSAGAYTPCHQDTYGFNLVAQIRGSKRWFLFPPSDSHYMYPTRVPYEESSVFSEVNVRNPDLRNHQQFKEAQPHIVILQPGDVLYVPRHWWHFVECLEPSISVNTWIEMEEDVHTHFHEAVTRFLFSSLANIVPSDNMVNSYEQVESSLVNISYIQQALHAAHQSKNHEGHSANTVNKQAEARTEPESIKLEKGKSDQDHGSERKAKEFCSNTTVPALVNNFRKFAEAFKGNMVNLYEREFENICTSKASHKRTKRQWKSGQSGEGLTLSDQCSCGHEISVCSKYAKYEHMTSSKNRDCEDSELHRCSVVCKCDTCIAMKNSHTCEVKELTEHIIDSGLGEPVTNMKPGTDNCDLKICTVPKLAFPDYVEFLRLEFDYEENINMPRENSDNGSSPLGLNEAKIQTADTFAVDVINSIVDQNVVTAICNNLFKKFKDEYYS